MLVLKIPIFGLFGIVWWAVKKDGRAGDAPTDDGRSRPGPAPHPPRARAPRPRRAARPHGDPMPLPPPRVRRVTAIGREHADRLSLAGCRARGPQLPPSLSDGTIRASSRRAAS